MFDRTPNLENTQIINYRVDPQEKWCVLVGIAPGAPERYADACLQSYFAAIQCYVNQGHADMAALQTGPGQGFHATLLCGAEA